MAYSSIPSGWLDVGQAVKKELVDLIDSNLEDLNGRVTSVEGSISTVVVANQTIKKERDHAPIGTMVWTPLSEAQFQTATDDGDWELCDGSSASGTDYGTLMSRSVLPDVRGRFLRMADGSAGRNPSGNLATDTAQTATTANFAHTHTIDHGHANTFALGSATVASSTHSHNIAHTHQYTYVNGSNQEYSPVSSDPSVSSWTTAGGTANVTSERTLTGGGASSGMFNVGTYLSTPRFTGGVVDAYSSSGSTALSGPPQSTSTVTLSGAVTSMTGSSGSSGTATESRPINVTENLMIKVNKNYVTARTGYLLWRAPQAVTINQVILAPVTQGTSGTLTIDIKKGVLGSISTSIFTSLPDMAYNDATAQTGTLDATNSQIAAGEYVRLDITTTQAKLEAFHILIAAAPG